MPTCSKAILGTQYALFTRIPSWLFCFRAPSSIHLFWQKCDHTIKECCSQFASHVCFLAWLDVVDLTAIDSAKPVKIPPLTGLGIEGVVGKVGTPGVAG